MTTFPRSLVPFLLLACAACGSTAPSRFFALTTLEPGAEPARGSAVLLVDPVEVAEYLDRPQLLRRTSAVELDVDEYHRWAEPLDAALTRVLGTDLRLLLDAENAPADARVVRVALRVTRFERDAEGRAVLEAGWALTPVSPQGAQRRGTWLRRAALERPDDPAALAAALDGLVHELARDLAGEIAG